MQSQVFVVAVPPALHVSVAKHTSAAPFPIQILAAPESTARFASTAVVVTQTLDAASLVDASVPPALHVSVAKHTSATPVPIQILAATESTARFASTAVVVTQTLDAASLVDASVPPALHVSVAKHTSA